MLYAKNEYIYPTYASKYPMLENINQILKNKLFF